MAKDEASAMLKKDLSVSILDYVVLVVILLASLGIGIFYSCKQRTQEEYLHGGRKMSLLPVAISMVVSQISAITLQVIKFESYGICTKCCPTMFKQE